MDTEHKERFLALLEPVYPRLSRYALAMTRNREEAKDLVSEAVLVALERFDTIRDEAGFAGFLFRIVSRTHKRWHYRERMRSPFTEHYSLTVIDTGTQPDRSAEAAIVIAALDRLPAKTKETILLFDVADLSLEEIRQIQGGSLSGVKSRIRRGHESVRRMLGIAPEPARDTTMKREDFSTILLERAETYAV
jgi:RNA polymerase sigma-70 factor (ECF subfamily)